MKRVQLISTFFALALASANMSVLADEHDHDHDRDHHDDHHYVHHDEWKKGYRMHDEDWHRGAQIDYREHHLRAPPHGYEWREVDGNYVLAAVATGVIASVIVASAAGH